MVRGLRPRRASSRAMAASAKGTRSVLWFLWWMTPHRAVRWTTAVRLPRAPAVLGLVRRWEALMSSSLQASVVTVSNLTCSHTAASGSARAAGPVEPIAMLMAHQEQAAPFNPRVPLCETLKVQNGFVVSPPCRELLQSPQRCQTCCAAAQPAGVPAGTEETVTARVNVRI